MASLPHRPIYVGIALGALLAVMSITLFSLFGTGSGTAADPTTTDPPGTTPPETTVPITVPTTDAETTTTAAGQFEPEDPYHPWIDRRTVGRPWGNEVEGLLTFRGNPTNTYYGEGPVPATPEIKWRYPQSGPLCGQSTDLGTTSTWCGNGWTGQPVVWERPDGVTELMVGAFDHRFHFIDAATGTRTRSPIQTQDIVKGSPTLDPDGFPLVYFGSRDNKLRLVALDREDPVELWAFETPKPLCTLQTVANHGSTCFGLWNDDWDAAPRIVNGYLFAAGENSVFYIWKLNRSYDALGMVQVEPELIVEVPSWTDELIADIQAGCTVGVRCISTSIESTPVFFEGRVYFGNSAGRVMGLDITKLETGEAPIVFDFWVGDDVDGSIVIDDEGMLYVPVEWKRFLPRGREIGQVVKLDPYTSGDPVVWSWYSLTEPPTQGGLWSTPALGEGVLYVTTNKGFVCAIDLDDGDEVWCAPIAARTWSSPVVVGDRLIVVDKDALMWVWDVTDPRAPRMLWSFRAGDGIVDATPAVWKGTIFIFNWDGYLYAVGNKTS
jgi:outer membrane protein assembly factor BamB